MQVNLSSSESSGSNDLYGLLYVSLSLKGLKMKKTLIALAVLGATAGVAHAQSNVTIYGIADIGYVKQTGSDVYMTEKVNNRLGFRGVEDLGGGLKATFELEERFTLEDGQATNGRRFDGASNLGLASKWGALRFGRMNEVPTEYYRTLDPFNQYGVAGMFENPYRSARISNTVRYDSPNVSGFNFAGTFSLQNQTGEYRDTDASGENAGYGVGVRYANGPLSLLATYNRPVNSDDSNGWNVGGSYAFGPLKVSAGYEKVSIEATREDRNFGGDLVAGDDWNNILVGLSYKIGAGTINASYNQSETDTAGTEFKDKKFALGYTHDVSKRTSVYLDYSLTKWDDDRDIAGSGFGDDDIHSFQVGITHKF